MGMESRGFVESARPEGYVFNSDDCDDAASNVSPSAEEICNGIDDNCDTVIDDGVQILYYLTPMRMALETPTTRPTIAVNRLGIPPTTWIVTMAMLLSIQMPQRCATDWMRTAMGLSMKMLKQPITLMEFRWLG